VGSLVVDNRQDMLHTKKMILMDPNSVSHDSSFIRPSNLYSALGRPSMTSKAMDSLDNEIKNTLESDLPEDVKAKLYLASIKQFKTYDYAKSHPKTLVKQRDVETDLLLSFPDSERHIAKAIYTALGENADV